MAISRLQLLDGTLLIREKLHDGDVLVVLDPASEFRPLLLIGLPLARHPSPLLLTVHLHVVEKDEVVLLDLGLLLLLEVHLIDFVSLRLLPPSLYHLLASLPSPPPTPLSWGK